MSRNNQSNRIIKWIVMFGDFLVLNVIILAVMAVGLAVIYLFCRRQIKEVADPVAAQQAVMEREMNIAHNIQKAMLPSEFTPRPLTSFDSRHPDAGTRRGRRPVRLLSARQSPVLLHW